MNLSRNFYRLWAILLVISGGIALWFLCMAVGSAWKYVRLNDKAVVNAVQWQVKEITSSRFALEGDYQFEVDGKQYSGKTLLEKPQFLNRFAAENYMAIQGSKTWETWYRKSKPQSNSLERDFPKKKCLQAVLTLGVFLYFFFARTLVMKLPSVSGKKLSASR